MSGLPEDWLRRRVSGVRRDGEEVTVRITRPTIASFRRRRGCDLGSTCIFRGGPPCGRCKAKGADDE